MAPVLYMVPQSPPVRAVQMTAKALGLKLELKKVDVMKGEHLSPEYLKMNPQHTVPVLVDDDGFTIWDSHAINIYLVSKYGENNSLYPEDLQKRAVIDQRLHFECWAFGVVRTVMFAILTGKSELDQVDKDKIYEIYGFLEAFLEGKEWLAGDSVTLADYSSFTCITSTNVLVPVDGTKYPNLDAWLKKVGSLPEADENRKGLDVLKMFLRSKGII